MWKYRASLRRVVDGDTYDMQVDLGFYTYRHLRIRLLRVDTHEIFGQPKESEEYKRGMEEKQFVEDWFEQQDNVTIRTEMDGQGKYGRWLAEVHGDDECLNDRLLEEFEGISYDGVESDQFEDFGGVSHDE